jgi:MGT family glycosyltransferase
MARVLLYTSPAPGHIYPPAETAIELKDQGHDVLVCTGQERVDTFKDLGFDARSIDPRIEDIPIEDWKGKNPLTSTKLLVEGFHACAPFEMEEVERLIETERPDLVWIDVNCLGGSTVAEASGIPWAHYLPYPHPFPAVGVPAYGPGFAPPEGRLDRARDRLVDLIKAKAYPSVLRAHNEWRRRRSLTPLSRGEDFFLTAPLLIQFSAEPFEYPRAWPENVRLVGPGLWEPPAQAPEWLAEESRPIVLATASTVFQDDGALIATALEALADTEYLVVATTSAHDPGDFATPANARVERFLPHGPILERATAVLSHGGMGTTQKTLAAGVPVCVVPFLRDQFEIARRVEVCEAGASLPAKKLTADSLRSTLGRARRCEAGAQRVASALGAAGGAKAAAAALLSLTQLEKYRSRAYPAVRQ